MDLDYICVKPFSELVYRYSYFSGLEPPIVLYNIVPTSVAIIGVAKDNQIMKTIRENFELFYTDPITRDFYHTHFGERKWDRS
jgi:hypothetical protein